MRLLYYSVSYYPIGSVTLKKREHDWKREKEIKNELFGRSWFAAMMTLPLPAMPHSGRDGKRGNQPT